MSFANVAGLLWLIPLAGIIILLYLLKMRRKDLRVPATFLWPKMTYEVRANSLFQKLRLSWLLFLQLLALALIVLGFSQPQVREEGLAGNVTVLVIDASASMSATDVGSSRFDEAKRIAASIVASVRSGDRVSIIEAGPIPRVASPLSGDSAKLRNALNRMDVTHADADVGEALRLASSLTSRQPNARIILFSDGVFPAVSNFSAGDAEIVFTKIGNSGANAGITALGASETPEGRQLYFEVKNFGPENIDGTLNLHADGKLIDSHKLTLTGGEKKGKVVGLPDKSSVVEASFESDDILQADNYAATILDSNSTVRVLLITAGDLFLERALSLDPRVILDKAEQLPSTEKAGTAGVSKYDLIIFESVPEQPVKAKAVLTFGRAGPSSPVTTSGAATTPRFISARSDSPVMSAVDLRNVYIDSVQKVTAKSNGEVLAESSAGPLIVASTGAQRQLYVAFRPLDSDFPLQASFPIFVSNALDFCSPREARSSALSIQPGRAFSIPVTGEEKALSIDGPSGATVVEPTAGAFLVRAITLAGKHELSVDGKSRAVYATLGNTPESDLMPAERVLLGGERLQATGSVLRLADYWRYFLFFALLVLGVEWWLYARRS